MLRGADALETLQKNFDEVEPDRNRMGNHVYRQGNEVEDIKAKHAEEEGRWSEQHAHQHAVNQKLAERVEKAESEVAAMREALIAARTALASHRHYHDADKISEILAQPGPGATLLERVTRLEKAARKVLYKECSIDHEELELALDARARP